MIPNNIEQDLWGYLQQTDKTVVMYGMGNGADKILRICEERGIAVADFFASDGFVRGHAFHGRRVLTYSECCEKYGKENMIVLLSFATSLPDVMERILQIASECELYAPDVPVFGQTLFDLSFYRVHQAEMARVWERLADEPSKRVYEDVICYKLTGKLSYLTEHVSTPEEAYTKLLQADAVRTAADLGAYNGDTVRELAAYAPALEKVFALEPDRRNFRKLQEYAKGALPYEVQAVQAAAWSDESILHFDASGNRNANIREGGKTVEVQAMALDTLLAGQTVDYIKYDVEGSEREALQGSKQSILRCRPRLLVSLYHRSEDLYALPQQILEIREDYRLYLRRYSGFPAWDLNLYCL